MSNWPQWFYIGLLGSLFVQHVYKDGKNNDVFGLIATLIVFPSLALVLYVGGFWTSLGWSP